jgi:hypothetical protein
MLCAPAVRWGRVIDLKLCTYVPLQTNFWSDLILGWATRGRKPKTHNMPYPLSQQDYNFTTPSKPWPAEFIIQMPTGYPSQQDYIFLHFHYTLSSKPAGLPDIFIPCPSQQDNFSCLVQANRTTFSHALSKPERL